MKKAIFIADAHLRAAGAAEYGDLLKFLDGIKDAGEKPDALFVLGDLFDFFVAFPKVVFYEHLGVLARLHDLSERGVRVIYFEGNHDFFLKKLNRVGFPLRVVEGAMDLDCGGRKMLVTHGDLIDRSDYAHRLLTAIVRNPLTGLLAYILPPHLVFDFAHFFSRFSRENISNRRMFNERVFDVFAAGHSARGYGGAVLGHFHRPMVIRRGEFVIHLVGSWKQDRSYLVYENGAFEHKTFS